MRAYIAALAGYGISVHMVAALDHAPQATMGGTSTANLNARDGPALVVQDPKNYGYYPFPIQVPTAKPTPANIERHREYYVPENGTTKWVGGTDSEFAIATTTKTMPNSETSEATATITKGVIVDKNDNGGLDIVLSPAVKTKLEQIAKDVTPCPNARRRSDHERRGPGDACGLADFVQRVGADEELQGSFAEPATDQTWNEVDSAYGGDDPADDPGWEGDGDPGWEDASDEGYFSDDDSGFFEGAEGGEGEGTLETIIVGTEEEAAVIGAALSGAEAAEALAVWGGSTVTAGSFLAWLWGGLQNGDPLPEAQEIPSESIQTVTKSKSQSDAAAGTTPPSGNPSTASETEATTSEAPSCPSPSGELPTCGEGCEPTSTQSEAEETGVVDWACSQGETKDCLCNPAYEEIVYPFDADLQKIMDDTLASIKQPEINCPGDPTDVPSKWLVNQTARAFCENVMQNPQRSLGYSPYDMKGNKLPRLRRSTMGRKSALGKRTPPESIENYMGYLVYLSYDQQDGDCLVEEDDLCRNSYEALVSSNCGQNHGSAGDRLFDHASIDVGCGLFEWWVHERPGGKGEPSPPADDDEDDEEAGQADVTLGDVICNDAHDHDHVDTNLQVNIAEEFCEENANGVTMAAGDGAITWDTDGTNDSGYEHYVISWIEGCDMVKVQDVEHPIQSDQSVTCTSIMQSNNVQCEEDNAGAGGHRDIGCLRYEYFVD